MNTPWYVNTGLCSDATSFAFYPNLGFHWTTANLTCETEREDGPDDGPQLQGVPGQGLRPEPPSGEVVDARQRPPR